MFIIVDVFLEILFLILKYCFCFWGVLVCCLLKYFIFLIFMLVKYVLGNVVIYLYIVLIFILRLVYFVKVEKVLRC